MPSASEHVFRKAITAGSLAPVYYLYGDDDFRKDDAASAALAMAVEPSSRGFDLDVRRANDLDAEAIVTLLETPPLAGPRRAVAIRDVHGLKKDARRELERYLEHPAADLLLLLVAAAGEKVDRTLSERTVAVE